MKPPCNRSIGVRTPATSLAFLALTLSLPAVELTDLAGDWTIAEFTTLYSNTTGEILLVSDRDADQQEQTLCLKRPTDLTNADLTGDWTLITMTNPDDLSKNTDGFGRISDVWFPGDTSLTAGGITVDGSGNFTGIFDGSISGTPTGDVTVVSDGGSIPFKTNASKNVGYSVSMLYFVNTLGAGIGALLAAFIFLGMLGLTGSLYVAVALNILAGLTILHFRKKAGQKA